MSGLFQLETLLDNLGFEQGTGKLVSFCSKSAPGQEFIASAPEHPAFNIQYLDEYGSYRQITSLQAASTDVTFEELGDGFQCLVSRYTRVGGFALDVTITVTACKADRFSRWNISINNQAGLRIFGVEYPVVVASYDIPGDRAIIRPFSAGEMHVNPMPGMLAPDWPRAWQFQPDNGDSGHYPGGMFAQFLAYYNDKAGLYLACEDTEGNIKLFAPLHREPGIRLGISHIGDWPDVGERTLEYDVVLGSFTGDWYDAADIYREWALQQKWGTPLHERTDVPEWLLESPPYITVRPQGELDTGPVLPLEEFLPYEKVIPLLDGISQKTESTLVAVIMGWERGGSWVYPDCFPPIGGDESVTNFTRMARDRGWHVGSFCNGTRWAMGHAWNGYDGEEYYKEHSGEKSVCKTAQDTPWEEVWDKTWRPSYTCCIGSKLTRDIARDFVRRIIGWGLQSIQFFDQNLGASTFPCFAKDHEHPAMPGKWMPEKMAQIIGEFHAEAAAKGETEVIHSTEQPANEYCLPLYQQCDCRVYPPGYGGNFLPLYHYIYHECLVIQGGMGGGPEPYHLPIRNAYNCVLGEIPGAVMTGDGTLLNKDTFNWAPWEPKVGNNDHALEVIRTTTAMRRGVGKDFLVYGRMQRPVVIESAETITWEQAGRIFRVPAVFDAAWQSPDGRLGVVLANWTEFEQDVCINDSRLGEKVNVHTSACKMSSEKIEVVAGKLVVNVPPHSCLLVEVKDS
jgi:hypothetical protein